MSRVKIADMILEINGADKAFFDHRLAAYLTDSTTVPEAVIRSRLEDEVSIPTTTARKVSNTNTYIADLPDHTHCRYVLSKDGNRALQAIYYNDDYSFSDIRLLSSRRNPHFSLTDFEYMYTGTAFAGRLIQQGGVVLHGSALSYNGQGIVFTADSGTGKSTHTELWKQAYPDEITVINDDKPALRFYGDKATIFGTPWSGKTAINANISAPLNAVVVLEQAPHNAIRPLTTKEAIFHLTQQINRPYYDRDSGIKTLNIVDKLIQTVPLYLLQCTISQEAVSLVYNTVFRKDVSLCV